ncbi:MAG: hypothetical protein PHU33_01770, partial [Bacteroidales bacterium]|nr:hypothetical protein [Bacteroidales bacterium]
HYQWLVNGTNAGTDDPSYAYEPMNGDLVTCQLTSNAVCSTGSPATSNAITLTVNPPVAVSINIVASATTLCEGETVTFTASPVNGGTEPHYQWLVNGTNVGTDDPSFAYEPANGDVVTCQLTSNAVCSTGSPATSNAITLTVNPPVAVSINIVASATTLCEGETVTFTASPVNGGTEPHYQWLVNGVNAGTDDPSFAYEPSNSDVVTCQLTSNAACSTGSPAQSNQIAITALPALELSVSITASSQKVCIGTGIELTALVLNGGPGISYQWKLNGVDVGTNQPLFTFIPADNDEVVCVVTNQPTPCLLGNPATSNTIVIRVGTPPPPKLIKHD